QGFYPGLGSLGAEAHLRIRLLTGTAIARPSFTLIPVEASMAFPERRRKPRVGPSDSSDTIADRPGEPASDTDEGGTGERVTIGQDPEAELRAEIGPDRIVGSGEAGLGGGLDEAEEARLRKKPQKRRKAT